MKLLLQRLAGFGVVGVIATLTYAIAVIVLVESLALAPAVAAVLAFVVAMQVSYLGNVRWVFADRVTNSEQAGLIIRFVGVSSLSFILNVGGMYILTELAELSYWWGVVFSVVAVPLVTFLAHNSWTFSGKA